MISFKSLFQREFIKFALVGVVGFIVDIIALYFGLYIIGLGVFASKILSYLVASTTTWYLNRNFTFQKDNSSNLIKEWVSFVGANGVGGVINFTIYTLIIYGVSFTTLVPLIASSCGSIAGLIFNFTISSKFIFKSNQN